MLLDSEVYPLLEILKTSIGKSPKMLWDEVCKAVADQSLQQPLNEAIFGENRPLNAWLFNESTKQDANLVWLAPVKSDRPKYVWMIGKPNPEASKVHEWYKEVRQNLYHDPLLVQRKIPPSLLFVDPIAISSVTLSELVGEDEFAIFQTAYEKTPDEVPDIEQRMVINMKYSITKRKSALIRLQSLCDESEALTNCFAENLELFSVLHNEGHNQGHFVGHWPHEDVVKKTVVLYEAVEEFRACLASVLLATHLPISQIQKEAFALSVFATRFFGFGYDAFMLQSQRRETAREIVVGVFFFEWLMKEGVLELDLEKCRLRINSNMILSAFFSAFLGINNAEKKIAYLDSEGLREIATNWYKFGFPNKCYSQNVQMLYTKISERR